MSSSSPSSSAPVQNLRRESVDDIDDPIVLRDLFNRLMRGAAQTVGLSIIGLALAATGVFFIGLIQPISTSTRVVFSFPGFERGQYPDKSTFQADDLRAPAVVAEAIRRLGLNTSNEFQSTIRGGLNIEGIVPPNIIKDRDRLRAAGQTPPTYIPDEYMVSLTLDRSFALSRGQREKLVQEIVSVYRENFGRTYTKTPAAFGTAFETLRQADYSEYELILNADLDNVRAYLAEQQNSAAAFRSPNTNFSFKDLSEQTELFAQIQLNEVLGLIREDGLSKNRRVAMTKMDYYLRQLNEQEQHALEDEKVVKDLLAQTETRAQNVVLGVKTQAAQPRSDSPVLDQGLIDSLLANDAHNFLIRRALDAGLKVKGIQAEKNRVLDLRDNMKSFIEAAPKDQTAVIAQIQGSLKQLEANYQKLMTNIRQTQVDFARQQYGNAVRLSDQVRTPGLLKPLAIAGIIGGFLGVALGMGLSLLGVYIGRRIA